MKDEGRMMKEEQIGLDSSFILHIASFEETRIRCVDVLLLPAPSDDGAPLDDGNWRAVRRHGSFIDGPGPNLHLDDGIERQLE